MYSRLLLQSISSSLRFVSNEARPMVQVKWLGQNVSYADGLKAQSEHVQLHLDNPPDKPSPHTLLLLEHRPVYTVGIRSGQYTLEEEERLKSLGADFEKSDRGGLITFHGPGQLVAYPILDLAELKGAGSIRWYVQQLETWIQHFAKENFRLEVGPMEDCTGVWLRGKGGNDVDRKIAAIGIHVTKRRLTSHGLAFNVSTDLAWFDNIVPCGILGKGVTSLSREMDKSISTLEVLPSFVQSFQHVFKVRLEFMPGFPSSCQ